MVCFTSHSRFNPFALSKLGNSQYPPFTTPAALCLNKILLPFTITATRSIFLFAAARAAISGNLSTAPFFKA